MNTDCSAARPPEKPHLRRAGAQDLAGGSLNPPILIIPGVDNSGPAHWQSHWQRSVPAAERVEQTDWARPTLGEWSASVIEAVRRRPGALLVAHSLGCALVAHVARVTGGRGIAGALLVAPADVDRPGFAEWRQKFAPMPRLRLPFPSSVVASQNDPFVEIGRAKALARDWGAGFTDLGAAGHINAESGHGPWDDGRGLLQDLVDRTRSSGLWPPAPSGLSSPAAN